MRVSAPTFASRSTAGMVRDARTQRSELPSGMKMALLPKKTRGGTVVGILTLRFGDEKSLAGKTTAADLAADMLIRGTTRRTRQQIKDELDRLKARMSVGGRASQATLSFETVRENLPAVLKLAAEILREPAFPQKEFEELRQENLAGIEQQRSECSEQDRAHRDVDGVGLGDLAPRDLRRELARGGDEPVGPDRVRAAEGHEVRFAEGADPRGEEVGHGVPRSGDRRLESMG